MRWYTKLAAAALAATLQACVTPPANAPLTPPPAVAEVRAPVTILISIDGFRADYLDRGATPVLSELAATGVRAAMIPSFPSKTFPNHYTLVTGLRPDRNGIVANRMLDPRRPGEVFTMATLDSFWWDEAEPVWVAAEKAGIRTATMFWPGSNSKVMGTYPHDWQQFNQDVTGRQRVDAIVDWLRRPADNRPKFLTLYFDTVDTAGHQYGPDAAETTQAVADVDALVGRLKDALDAMRQPVNFVIVADHGMAPMSEDRVIPLYTMLPRDLAEVVEDGPYAAINPTEGKDAALARVLLSPRDHMQCWRKDAIPERFHYGHNARVPAYICLAETGWTIRARAPRPDAKPMIGGNHGWDNQDPSMRALFIANGPAFRPGATLPSFDNVDVEPLLRILIGLPPHDAAIDGTAAPFAGVLIR
ncbi:MAG: ectonucleotide pyrophosphatase/phosphodiesterase [Pseudomonadota bacterium]